MISPIPTWRTRKQDRTGRRDTGNLLAVALAGALILLAPAPSPAANFGFRVPAGRLDFGLGPRRPAIQSPKSKIQNPKTYHYAVYMLGSRVGTSEVTEAHTTFEGHQARRVDAKTDMKL